MNGKQAASPYYASLSNRLEACSTPVFQPGWKPVLRRSFKQAGSPFYDGRFYESRLAIDFVESTDSKNSKAFKGTIEYKYRRRELTNQALHKRGARQPTGNSTSAPSALRQATICVGPTVRSTTMSSHREARPRRRGLLRVLRSTRVHPRNGRVRDRGLVHWHPAASKKAPTSRLQLSPSKTGWVAVWRNSGTRGSGGK